jgi:hypothetical protein
MTIERGPLWVIRAILPHFVRVRFPPNRVGNSDRKNFGLGTNPQRCPLRAQLQTIQAVRKTTRSAINDQIAVQQNAGYAVTSIKGIKARLLGRDRSGDKKLCRHRAKVGWAYRPRESLQRQRFFAVAHFPQVVASRLKPRALVSQAACH